MIRTQSLSRVAATAAVAAALVAGAAPATFAKSPESKASGTCSQGATWKLKAKADNGRVQVELEVDSNRNGQSWAWTLRDNGTKVGSGTAVTVAPSGSFTVARRIANRAGTDTITAVATHAGQTCSARVVFAG
ncbi:hypothetical protein KMZ32_14110 [Phycicoccus sp. MAQZ13P-2]|uniref:hypothetical protein n=1 Tax=Phycicoccus mangrovi TaxID=2840470 RepID=UPI001C005B65|nr:hypothetical protein [Phycicoccus mangrovi]MBT9256559.1 hypothetical protein [Phycicoccus mangrovi]MBT9275207.1 hypothetical protein [Phycicoccus mangrovi]